MGVLDRFRTNGTSNEPAKDESETTTESGRILLGPRLVIASSITQSRRLVDVFKVYSETTWIPTIFIIYSILIAILLSGLAILSDNISLMFAICIGYAITAMPFLYWLNQAIDDGRIDPNEFR